MGTAATTSRRRTLWRDVVGAVLRETRRRRGERLADVAGRAGVSPQYLSEIERGRKEPSSEILAAVAAALDLTLADVTRRVTLVLEAKPRRHRHLRPVPPVAAREPAAPAEPPHHHPRAATTRSDAILLAA